MTTPRIASPGLRVITATAHLCPRLAGTYNYRPAVSPGGGAPVPSYGVGSAERKCADDGADDTDRDKQYRQPSPVTGHRPRVETMGKQRVVVVQTSLGFREPT